MNQPAAHSIDSTAEAVRRFRELATVATTLDGNDLIAYVGSPPSAGLQPVAHLSGIYPEWLGEREFTQTHGVRFPYVAGAMANGIASVDLVTACARAGILAFYGAAGLGLPRIERDLNSIARNLGTDAVWGANLIHAPNEPELEAATAELFIRHRVTRVSASAYMKLTDAIVRYACTGLYRTPAGHIGRSNSVFAKISRPEVAKHFMSPAPESILRRLLDRGELTSEEAQLARHVPVAEDITVEADSGGHTDNQPLGALFPVIANLRDRLTAEHGFSRPIRVGAAGGIGTPQAAASAFALGADYILTGSVNQAAVESGLSEAGRELLAKTMFGDVMMAPAADMFELGVKLQVLKRGTMFGVRAEKLWEIYRSFPSLDSIPPSERDALERRTLGATIDSIWSECESFWSQRDPAQLQRAANDAKHRMALVFRWYLGMSSRWAILGTEDRVMDYQIWCGPAMASFNDWTRGSALESPSERGVVPIALNILEGAAQITRASQLRALGVPVPVGGFRYAPRRISL